MSLDNPILSSVLNHISLAEIKERMGPAPWSHPVVLADHIAGVVICQPPGQENDRHVHGYDEWWVIMEGAIDWIIVADVYHEMSDPEPMLEGIRRALSPTGRVALLEYRIEDGTGDQIKADHVMSVRQVLLEWQAAGFELVAFHEFLPSQHLFFFRVAGSGVVGEVVADRDLFEAMDAGLVEVEARAAGNAAVVYTAVDASDTKTSSDTINSPR